MSDGLMSMKGGVAVQKIAAPGPGLAWKVKNVAYWFPGFWRMLLAVAVAKITHLPVMYGQLALQVIRADGGIINYGVVTYRVVTTAGVNAIAASMLSNATTPLIDAYDFHASGTGVGSEVVGDTTLGTDSGVARVSGTPTNPSANLYRSIGTQTYTSTLAITEHGLFSASTSGTLLDRSVFSAVNVVNGDSIQFTYTLTITAGG